MEPRSRLVSKEEMLTGLAAFVPQSEMSLERAFYSQLAKYAGYEAGPRELVMLLTQAFEKRSGTGTRFNLTHIIDAMVGEQGKALGDATKKIFENIAKVAAGVPRS